MKLHEKLYQLRKEKGLTQAELAERLEVSRQSVSNWEVGTTTPSTKRLRDLSQLYDVPLDYLLNNEDTVPLSKDGREVDISLAEIESYSDGEYVTNYYNNEKKYCVMYPSRERMLCEQELPEDMPRVFMETGNDVPSYINRTDPTNTVFGSYCLFPQGFTFGFLTDFNLWEIDGNTQYLDRDCIMLSGWATGSYGEKLGVQTFSMFVDRTTGILLKLEGKDQRGEITTYMTVNSISIDGPVAQEMDQHDMSKYEDYTEINTGMLFE